MTSMKAVTFANFGAPSVLQATTIERPAPGVDDVLVRIHAAGVCYHDVLSRGGKIPGGEPGRVLGHEIAGEIVETGTNVPASRVGERVVIYQRLYCGQCRYCLSGRQDLCRNSRVLGESGGGGYAEFTCAPARNAIRMPDGLDMKSAALAVCPVGTSVRATLGVAQVEPGQTVLITGAGGGLGLHQIQVAKSVSAHVIAELERQGRDHQPGRRRRGDRQPGLEVLRRGLAPHAKAGCRRCARKRRLRHVRREHALGRAERGDRRAR
jgi:acryloyl-coenzyme A reductase